MTNTRLQPHDWVGGALHLLFLFLEQAVPPVVAEDRDGCAGSGGAEEGVGAGKPQPSVTSAAFLISALVPSSAAVPVQPSKPLDALSSVSALKPT